MQPSNTKKTKLNKWLARKKKLAQAKAGIPKMLKDAPIPLSRGQERLWLLQQLYPDNPFYQYAHAYRFKGPLNVDVLLASFQLVAQRHEVLRTTFKEENLKDEQHRPTVSLTGATIPTEIIDLQHLTIEKQAKTIASITHEKATQIFDLSKDILLRVTVLVLSENDYYVLLSMHHIVGDRWSLQVLNEELAATYQELQNGENTNLQSLKIQYSDYAHWQRSQAEKPEDLAFWLEHLSGELPVLALPTDFPRPAQPSFQGVSTTKLFSKKLSQQIKDLCKAQHVTPYVLLLAAYQVLLHRYTGQEDILIGTPFTNRDKTVLEKLIGFFNETLVLRADLSNDPSFVELVAQVKNTTNQALAHKNTPFDTLVRTLKPERNGTANPLFQVMFLYNTLQETPAFAPDISVEEMVVDLGVSKFDLTLFITDKGEHLTATFEYATDLFEIETIERLHRHLEILLQSIVENPLQRISALPILSPEETQKILVDWNDTAVDIDEHVSVLDLFEQQVATQPHNICITYEQDSLTYQAVNERATAIAKGLKTEGVIANQIVGLHTQRSVDLIVGIVAILKAGGAYLPLDPEYPAERIAYMLEDAAVKVVLSQAHIQAQLPQDGAKILNFKQAIEIGKQEVLNNNSIDNQQLAYLIYTSGSTGKPKGVPITHRNLIYSTAARFHFYKHQPAAFLLLSSFAFDSSVVGLFWTITTGGTLVLPKKRIEQDLYGLADLIAHHKVTHTLMLPSLYDLLMEHAPVKKLQSLNTIMVAGEACATTVVKRHFQTLPQATLYNEYGPTEGTVWCTAHEITKADQNNSVPIGRPIPNVKNYILNQHQQPVPIGVAGELYISGPGLSKGYLKRPELTAKKFISVDFKNGETTRLYRTGDLAAYRADGLINFLGRADQQVKIRGYRIELDEIREIILQQAGIREAVVLVQKEGGQQRLVAYYTTNQDIEIADLRVNLKSQLPNYMVPAILLKLDAFPRLPNGKINRHALPAPETIEVNSTENFEAPQTALEQQIATVWKAVLNINPIGRNDNFFDIGGDSILSIQIIAKLRQANLSLAANQLFEHQSIATLATSIEQQQSSSSLRIKDLPNIEQNEFPLSFMQQAFLMHSLQETDDQGFLQLEFTIEGKIDRSRWEQAWLKTAERHPVLRTAMVWEGLEQPVQRVHSIANLEWHYLDWTAFFAEEQAEQLDTFRQADRAQGLDLKHAPIARLTLIQLAPQQHLLFWTCHHIILDGWSGGLVLKDALAFYEKAHIKLPALATYADFLHWKSDEDVEAAKTFWQETLGDFKTPVLFENGVSVSSESTAIYNNHSFSISEQTTAALHQFARQQRITLNTLLKGVWGILLSRYFGKKEVVFGTTVSGRFADFPSIDEMAGLFMNVLPTHIQINENKDITTWLQDFQQEQNTANTFDRNTLENITSWVDWPQYQPLFDSLFVFGNFMKDGLQVGKLAVKDFQGGFTSTYPLTIRVNPVAALGFDLRYDVAKISSETLEWFASQLVTVLETLVENSANKNVLTVESLTNLSPSPFVQKTAATSDTLKVLHTDKQKDYLAPRNATELHLTKLWEALFGHSPISVTDNFFDIGGKSLLAMQLFSKIEEELDIVLPPMTLMQHPTIEALAKLIQGESETEAWTTIVPLRASGSKTPLFCIHAGGAHVFFYSGLTRYLSAEQPVYAIQPQGLDGVANYHLSIEEMATHYIQEIRKVQPEGPYRLLGTCFSNAVCLEMAIQLEKMGLEVSMYIVDSAPAHLIPLEKSKPVRRFLRILQDQNWSLLYRKLRRRFLIIKKKVEVKKESEAQRRLRETINSLNSVYAAYTWRPFGGKITLIRSTQFANKEGKNFHIKQWKGLAKGGLEVHVVEGRHLTIFEEPAVRGLAVKLEGCLDG